MAGLDGFAAKLDPPMYVVTARAPDGERGGCLVGFASQSSIDPPRFVVWLSRANHTYRVACRASHLTVHLLDPEHHGTARLFGEETGDAVDKFARVDWRPGEAGSPVLVGSPGWFTGRVEARLDGGDHVGFLLAPVAEGPTEEPTGEPTEDPAGEPGSPDARRPRLFLLSDAASFSPGHPA
ncbi:flavin reductase family protein [Streptomyces sp. NPDC050848]|uniref:flavin reductase family protein n=1 Tax=Streptomyces sp. NPDC050848 TaxID=3155791 RepID=UPI00340E833A